MDSENEQPALLHIPAAWLPRALGLPPDNKIKIHYNQFTIRQIECVAYIQVQE